MPNMSRSFQHQAVEEPRGLPLFFKNTKDPNRVLKSFHPVYRDKLPGGELKKEWNAYALGTGCRVDAKWIFDIGQGMWNGANMVHLAAYTGLTRAMLGVLRTAASKQKGDDFFKTLLKERSTDYNWTVLHFAARGGRHDEISLLLNEHPYLSDDIDACDNEERTPLHRAAMIGGTRGEKCVRVLIDAGANPNAVSNKGVDEVEASPAAAAVAPPPGCRTPLWDALSAASYDNATEETSKAYSGVLQFLLMNTSKDLIQKAVTCLMGSRQMFGSMVAACNIVMYTDQESLQRVLLTNNSGQTPLLYYCGKDGNLSVVERLIDSVADEAEREQFVNHRNNNDDFTALHLALWHGHESVVEALLNRKADPLGGSSAVTPLENVNRGIQRELDNPYSDKLLLEKRQAARQTLLKVKDLNVRNVRSIFKRSAWFRLDEVWELLKCDSEPVFDVNALITPDDTLLTFAVTEGVPSTYLHYLLQLRPPGQPNGVNVDFNTALQRFVEKKRLDLVQVLLKHGASYTRIGDDYDSALTTAYTLLDAPDEDAQSREKSNEILKCLFDAAEAEVSRMKTVNPPQDWVFLREKIVEAADSSKIGQKYDGQRSMQKYYGQRFMQLYEPAEGAPTDEETSSAKSEAQKRERAIAKKLRQAAALKQEQAQGSPLTEGQKAKVLSIPQLEIELDTLQRQNALDDEGTRPSAASTAGPPSAAPLLPAPAPPPPAPNVSLQDEPVDAHARAEPQAAARRDLAPAAAARAHASTMSIVEPPASRPSKPAREPGIEEDKVWPIVDTSKQAWKMTSMSYLFRGTWKTLEVVVKQWRQRQDSSGETENDLHEELKFHRKLTHDNIVPLLESVFYEYAEPTTRSANQVQQEYIPASKVLWLIFPYYMNGDLAAHIDKLQKKSIQDKREECNLRFIVQTLHGISLAMAYVKDKSRSRRAIHRDLKTENIFLDNELKPRLADFGCAKEFDRTTNRHTVGRAYTTHIRAPEQFNQDRNGVLRYNHKVDVFAFGHVIYELLSLDKWRKGDANPDVHISNMTKWSIAENALADHIVCEKEGGSPLSRSTLGPTSPGGEPSLTEQVEGLTRLFSGTVASSGEWFKKADEWFNAQGLTSVSTCVEAEMGDALLKALEDNGLRQGALNAVKKRLNKWNEEAPQQPVAAPSLQQNREREKLEELCTKAKHLCLPPSIPDHLPYHLEPERNEIVRMLLKTMADCFEFDYHKRPEFVEIIKRLELYLDLDNSKNFMESDLLWKPTERIRYLEYVEDYFCRGRLKFESDTEYNECRQTFEKDLTKSLRGESGGRPASIPAIQMPWSFEKMGLPVELGKELEGCLLATHSAGGIVAYDRDSALSLLNALRNVLVHFYDKTTSGDKQIMKRKLRQTYDEKHLRYLLADRLCELCSNVVACVKAITETRDLPGFHPPVGAVRMKEPC